MNEPNNSSELTQFEIQLKEYFPEIFQLHMLSKSSERGGGGEKYVWDLVGCILEMHRTGGTGIVFINYHKGRIENIQLKQDIIAHKNGKKTTNSESF